jgi:hypothetical protein
MTEEATRAHGRIDFHHQPPGAELDVDAFFGKAGPLGLQHV